MNILIVNTYQYYRAGAERLSLDLGKLLRKSGHSVHYFGMHGDENIICDDSDYFVSEIDYRNELDLKKYHNIPKIMFRSLYSFEAMNKLNKLLDILDIDVAHLHSIRHHLTKSILPVFKKRGIPVVWTLHDYKEICPNTTLYNGNEICEKCKDGRYHNVIKYKCKKGNIGASLITYLESIVNNRSQYEDCIDSYIAPSLFLKNKFIEFGYRPNKISHFPNFLITDDFFPNYEVGNYLLFLGRVEKEKGIYTLVNAFEKAIKTHPFVNLIIAGTGSCNEDLSQLIKARSLNGIQQLGYVSGHELEKITSEAAAIVIPSEWYENYPYSGLEAMAYGKPLIGSNIGGIPEMIENEASGFLFEPFNSNDLAIKIAQFFDLPRSTQEKMGRYSRKLVETINNPDRFLDHQLKVYTCAINNQT